MKSLDALIKVNILLMNYVSDKSNNYVIKFSVSSLWKMKTSFSSMLGPS